MFRSVNSSSTFEIMDIAVKALTPDLSHYPVNSYNHDIVESTHTHKFILLVMFFFFYILSEGIFPVPVF